MAYSVDVKEDFGAEGNGTTDDTEAIQAAIDAANIVDFPAGTYLVSRPLPGQNGCIILKSGLILRGAGVGQSIIKLADSQDALTRIVDADNFSNVTLERLSFNGNYANQSAQNRADQHCLYLTALTHLRLLDCEIYNSGGAGLQLWDGCDDFAIDHCLFHDMETVGLVLGGVRNGEFLACRFDDIGDEAIICDNLAYDSIRDIVFFSCKFGACSCPMYLFGSTRGDDTVARRIMIQGNFFIGGREAVISKPKLDFIDGCVLSGNSYKETNDAYEPVDPANVARVLAFGNAGKDTAAPGKYVINPTSSPLAAIDWSRAPCQRLDLHGMVGDLTIDAFRPPPDVGTELSLEVCQGDPARDITWPDTVHWIDTEPDWSADTGVTRIVGLSYTGAAYAARSPGASGTIPYTGASGGSD